MGGTFGNTELWDIDANLEKNLIVGVGKTSDYKILGETSATTMPYIAAFSIDNALNLWGFADKSKIGSYFQKVALSPNG